MAITIKISKPNKNALVSTTPDDFYLDSRYPLLKVHDSGSFSTNILGVKTITHSLGYIPFVLVFSEYVDDDGFGAPVIIPEFYQHDWLQEGASIEFFGYTKIYDDKIVITVGNTNAATPGVVDGFYYIFKDEVT